MDEKAARARTWYSLYTLEIALAEYTGRPCSVTLADVSAPTKGRGEEDIFKDGTQTSLSRRNLDSLNPARQAAVPVEDILSSYLSHRVQLSILSHQICSSLYNSTRELSWFDLQNLIRQLDSDLQRWSAGVPEELTTTQIKLNIRSAEPAIELAMYYWSVRMILFRPCLCNMEGRIEGESKTSRDFDQEAAAACITAALSLLTLVPDIPDRGTVYRILPWWALLHYISQAVAVLLLEICLGAEHCPFRVGEIMAGLRKAMSYLRMISGESLSAFKAWRVCRQLLADAASRLGWDTSDVPTDAPQPPGWNAAFETSIAKALDNTRERPFPRSS